MAVLPLAVLLLSAFSFVLTPVDNTITRTMEYEADMYGINASQQPDGEAEVDLMLGEYRKLDPGPIEEFIFFDHPSGRTRITAAMRWKAEHLPGAPLGVPDAGALGCSLFEYGGLVYEAHCSVGLHSRLNVSRNGYCGGFWRISTGVRQASCQGFGST